MIKPKKKVGGDLFDDSISDSSEDEDENNDDDNPNKEFSLEAFIPQKKPQEEVFEEGVKDMNQFLEAINKFEKITNATLSDLWKIKDTGFQPLKVSIDVQEYIPGLFDILKPVKGIELSRVMSVFCYLQIETVNLRHELESKFFDPLIYFGENGLAFEEIRTNGSNLGEQEIQMSRMLSVYRELFETIKKIIALTKNILYQMNGLFYTKSKFYSHTFKKLVYEEIFDNLGGILTNLYIVDLIIQENTNFQKYWEQYNRMFLITKNDLGKFNFTDKKLKKIQRFYQLYKVILHDTGKEFVFKHKEFQNKFLEYIKNKIDTVGVLLSSPGDMNSHIAFMNLLINYSLYRKLFENEDSKLYKKIWSLQKLCPIIILYNNLYVNAGNFLVNICALKKKTKCDPKDIKAFLVEQTYQKNQNFSSQMNQYYQKLVFWIVKMNSDILKDSDKMSHNREFLKVRSQLIISGIKLGIEIKRTLKSLILMHQASRLELQQTILKDIIQAVEMLKAIEIEFKTKKYMINQWVILINRYLCEEINIIIESGMSGIYKLKKGVVYEDMIFLMQTILECLKGGHNVMRKTIIKHCYNLLNKDIFSQAELNQLNVLGERIDIISNWEWYVKKATRCRFLYWIRSLFPLLFNRIMGDKHKLNQMNYFLMALNDPLDQLKNIKHLQSSQEAIDNYKKEIYQAFSDNMIKPICRKIEEELRMQIHAAIIHNLKTRNPYGKERIEDCHKYTSMSDLYLFEKKISIAEEVRHYLSKIFYEMTALNPHDWKTYQQMRLLAQSKYQIDLIPSHLPSQTIEQGIDILFLLRNLNHFVSKYHYNLHTQVFIETTKETKQVKTISVNQMLYSIKTHGVGILGASVNTFYRFLTKKFNIFSEFLYDEFIYNPLLQEQRYFNNHKEKLNGEYPYERAEKVAKAIKKLGVLKGNLTFLDKFRQLITQFGNALGYVRMLRNASLKDNSNLIKYIPNVIEEGKFEDVANDFGIKGETLEACKIFDMVVRLLFKQSTDAADYLRILVKNFDGVFESDDCKHLKLFYIIIPPLTLNYIEHIQKAKDRIFKKNNKDAFLSEDGFPLGLAYLLKILNQIDAFNSLNWFDSMNSKFKKDLKGFAESNQRMNNAYGNGVEEEVEDELSNKRIKNLKDEFDLLNYCLGASLILFKDI